MVTAASIGVAAVTAAPASVNAAYDYKTTAKSDEYIASLFSSTTDKITVTPGFTVEDEFLTVTGTKRSGVLLTFANGVTEENGSVEITKAFKASELKNAITFLPLINEESQLGATGSFSSVYIEIVEKDGDAVKRQVTVTMVGGTWNGSNQTATAVKGEKFDIPTVSQTFAGYNKSNHDRLKDTPYRIELGEGKSEGVKYLRQLTNAFYTNAGFTGGRTGLFARDITYGYYQENGKVQVITDRSGNTGLESEDVSGFSVVRDLNVDTNARFAGQPGADNDFANALGSDQIFGGFSDNADLYIRIKAKSNRDNARLLITNIAGEDLSSPVKVSGASYKAVIGKTYTLPEVKSYFNKEEGEAFNGTYTIYGPDGEIVTEKDGEGNVTKEEKDIAYVDHATFTPKTAGKYKVVYSTKDDKDNKYEGYYHFEAIEEATLKFTQLPAERTDFNTVRGNKFDLGAAAASTIYDEGADNTKVGVRVLYYGTSYENTVTVEKSIDDVGTSYPYVFKNAGKYRLVYGAYDEAGDILYYGDKEFTPDPTNNPDEKIACIEVEIKNLYNKLRVEEYNAETKKINDWAFGVQTETVKINRDIVKFYDDAFGTNFWGGKSKYDNTAANEVCTMTVKAPGEEVRDFTADELKKGYKFGKVFGIYEFTYDLTYVNDSIHKEFRINLIDDQAPEIYLIDSEYVYGAAGLVSGDGKNFVYNVTAGSQIKFGELRAEDKVGVKTDYTEDIKLVKILKNEETNTSDETDLTTEYQADRSAFAVTLTAADNGVIYKFSVQEDGGDGTDALSFTFNVQKSFITIGYDKVFKTTYGTDDTLKFDGFNVYNEKSESVSATKSVSVLRTGDDEATVIAGGTGNYKFVLSGEYVITFKAEYNGAKAEKSYTVSIVDKTAPEITVKGSVVKKGVKGDSILVPEFSGSDLESSANTSIKVVNAAGEEINVFEGKFVPTEAGTYTVTITAVDDAGNVNVYSYNVEVAEAATKSFPIFRVLGFTIGGLLIAAAAVFFVLAFTGKKSKVEDEE